MNTREHRFFAYDLAVDIARALVEPLKAMRAKDRHLWDQAYRSLKDMGLAVAEGGKRRKHDRAYFFDTAAGSAQELRMALTLSSVFTDAIDDRTAAKVDAMIDRELGMLWKLARRAEADAAASRRKR